MHKSKKGFTLIEMLIVIVIIGILAAALIPRLMGVTGRANDTARKADIQQISTAFVSYQIDHGQFPGNGGCISTISGELTSAGLNSIPTDPQRNKILTANDGCTTPGQFAYKFLTKNSQASGAAIIIAGVETIGGANYVLPNAGYPASYELLQLCTDITIDSKIADATNTNGTCVANSISNLRYISIQ
ncbi:MAG: prepilin-type N-terminal cleavage/methylation domain-containing protein [Candidatus Absconditabacterales bacterium]